MMGTRVCPRCGAPLAANQPFCGNCGLRFSQQPLAEQRSSRPHNADQGFYGAPTEEFSSRSPQVAYGSPPSSANPVLPYTPLPSNAPLPPMPRPPKRRSRSLRIALMAVIALLVFVIISGSVLVIVRPSLLVSIFKHTAKPTLTASPKPRNTATARAESKTATASHTHATATAHANASATASAANYPFSTNFLLNDPLTTKSNDWQTNANCSFTDGAYHALANQTIKLNTCMASNTNFKNFTYQVTMQINQGDSGGIVFRDNITSNTYYAFVFNQDGSYQLLLNTGTSQKILNQGSAAHSIFNAGLGQKNDIAVVLRGDKIDLYVKKQKLASVTGTALSSGQIGVVANDSGNDTDVSFTNAEVWKL